MYPVTSHKCHGPKHNRHVSIDATSKEKLGMGVGLTDRSIDRQVYGIVLYSKFMPVPSCLFFGTYMYYKQRLFRQANIV